MGLSAAVAGGIMMTMIVVVLVMAIPIVVNANVSTSRAYSEKAQLDSELLRTSIEISSLQASPASDIATITVANDGSSKLWNYEKFNVIVTFDGQVTLLESQQMTETLVYAGITEDVPAGHWGIAGFVGDRIDPRIMNTGESVSIKCRLSYNASLAGDVAAIISTDNGVTATRSEAIA